MKRSNIKKFLLVIIMLISTNIFSQVRPKYLPNNGSNEDRDWSSIKDFDDFVIKLSKTCEARKMIEQEKAKRYLESSINILLAKNYQNELNKVPVNENQFNEDVKKLKIKYEYKLVELESMCSDEQAKNIKYREELLSYFREVKLNEEREEAERERLATAKIEEEENERVEKEKQEQIAIVEYAKKAQKVLNSTEYKTWKAKYFSIIRSADVNKLTIDNLIKKYSFRNNFGHKVWDQTDLSKQDRITYDKNCAAIKRKIDAVNNLQEIGNNAEFEKYYFNSIKDPTSSKGVEFDILRNYYNTHIIY